MKRFLLVFLCLSLIFGAVACTDTSEGDNTDGTAKFTESETQVSAEENLSQYESVIVK